ncbi:BREX protein BrxB domain-containing protein [Leptolyngbya sp. BC1307]|uniref:BREX protein BrxB domain-containing protein n=1 Tax=Leptolyngbya sp. BC1307 TaxID=2029589 RepID=UPI000EFB9B9A|nr:BREX protein BrxB domain-containing protein [Leptolyngbya sp. BC1307]
MSSLKADFEDLRQKVRRGRELGNASFEPVYYLVFNPSDILSVKRQLAAWQAALKNDGWEVHIFSIAQVIQEVLQQDKRRKLWLMADRKAPHDWTKANQSLANALSNGEAIRARLETLLSDLNDRNGDTDNATANAIVLVTDLEALHPYLRIGSIENQLQGQFRVPTIFLYPGVRTGQTRLKFLGFYPEDGNYRSVHVGG